MNEDIVILGCGRWATFHAWFQAEELKKNVLVWGRENDQIYRELAAAHKNTYVALPASVQYTSDLHEALDSSNIILIAISAQAMPDLAVHIAKFSPKNKIFILCMKGLHCKSGERLSEILRRAIDDTNKICVWVGPGHVQELTARRPNAMMIAGEDEKTVEEIIKKFKNNIIRFYGSTDLIGVEVSAAAKNVFGIIAGMLEGINAGELRGALMCRGLYEISRLTDVMGGCRMTPFGLSCLGDFEATLFSKFSNNRALGEAYGRLYLLESEKHKNDNSSGKHFCFRLGDLPPVLQNAEGLPTCEALYRLMIKYKIKMPIFNAAYNVLYKGYDLYTELYMLLNQRGTAEFLYD